MTEVTAGDYGSYPGGWEELGRPEPVPESELDPAAQPRGDQTLDLLHDLFYGETC